MLNIKNHNFFSENSHKIYKKNLFVLLTAIRFIYNKNLQVLMKFKQRYIQIEKLDFQNSFWG